MIPYGASDDVLIDLQPNVTRLEREKRHLSLGEWTLSRSLAKIYRGSTVQEVEIIPLSPLGAGAPFATVNKRNPCNGLWRRSSYLPPSLVPLLAILIPVIKPRRQPIPTVSEARRLERSVRPVAVNSLTLIDFEKI